MIAQNLAVFFRTRFVTNSNGVTTDTHAAPFEARFEVATDGTTTDTNK